MEKIDFNYVNLSRDKRGFVRAEVSSPFTEPGTLKRFMGLAFCYSPIALVVDRSRFEIERITRYLVAQAEGCPRPVNLEWVKNAANRLDPGWQVVDGVLVSPDDSRLSELQVEDLLVQGQEVASLNQIVLSPEIKPPSPVIPRLRWQLAAVGLVGFLSGLAFSFL